MKFFYTILNFLVPRWRFFDDLGDEVQIEYRVRQQDNSLWSDWEKIPDYNLISNFNASRGLSRLFVNHDENLRLYKIGLVENFLIEHQELKKKNIKIKEREKFLNKFIFNYKIKSLSKTKSLTKTDFEFKINVRSLNKLNSKYETIFDSTVIEFND